MKSGNYSVFHAGYLVIKTVGYFPLQTALNAAEPYRAVLSSLKQRGVKTQELSFDSDAVVIWSVLWAGRMLSNRSVYQYYRSQNRPVIVIEVGALIRGHTWKIALNNATADGYYGHTENLDWDRPRKLRLSLSTAAETDPSIVIALQHHASLQIQGLNVAAWIDQIMQNVRAHTDRPIVIRPHPRSRVSLPPGVSVQRPQQIPGTYDNFDLPLNCHAIVNYNSGPGIQAAIAGVRPIVDPSSLAHPVSIDFGFIEQPYNCDRDQWFTEICHTEYTVDEIHQGQWIDRLGLL
jgi:hypothetical protein